MRSCQSFTASSPVLFSPDLAKNGHTGHHSTLCGSGLNLITISLDLDSTEEEIARKRDRERERAINPLKIPETQRDKQPARLNL